MHYFVDARSGKILDQWDGVQHGEPGSGGGGSCTATAAVGTGKTLTVGNVALNTIQCGGNYQLKDLTRGGGYDHQHGQSDRSGSGSDFVDADNTWGNNGRSAIRRLSPPMPISASADDLGLLHDVHGRNGIADDGEARSAACTTAATTSTPSGPMPASA